MTIKRICRPLSSILIAKGEQEDNNWISAEIVQNYTPLGVFFPPAHSSFCVASLAWRGSLFMSAYYWVDKMDHLVSSLILSPSFFWILSGQEALGSVETCHVTFGCQRSATRSKREGGWGGGGGCAHLMEMQKTSSAARSIHHHDHQRLGLFAESRDCVSRFEGAPQQRLEASERGAPPRRSKQLKPRFAMSKKIFPWMKESRHSNQKPGRRIAGLYEKKQEQRLFPLISLQQSSQFSSESRCVKLQSDMAAKAQLRI